MGFILLANADPLVQDVALALVDEGSEIKAATGDLEGLGTNFNQLGLHYRRVKRYQRSLVYMRRDLSVSLKLGDQRGIASSLMNLAVLYSDLKQLGPARQLCRQVRTIAESLNDMNLAKALDELEKRISAVGKQAGKSGNLIGPAALCMCESGKQYQYCCGLADFEPEDIPALNLVVPEAIEALCAFGKPA